MRRAWDWRGLPAVLAAVLVAALLVAGCGAGAAAGGGGPDPAKAMPANAVFYVEGSVRPSGGQSAAVRGLLGRVMRTSEPVGRLRALLDKALGKDLPGATYNKDIAPWLGRRVGFAATNIGGNAPSFIGAAAVTDSGKAADFVAREERRSKAARRSSGGHTYWVESDGSTVGVDGDYVLFASSTAQWQQGARNVARSNLAGSQRFRQAMAKLPAERVGAFYLDFQRFAALAQAQAGTNPGAAAVLQSTFGGVGAMTAAMVAGTDRLTIDSRVAGAKSNPLFGLGSGQAPALLRAVPANAWLAYGVPHVGAAVRTLIQTVGGGIGAGVISAQLQRATGLDLERDLLSWMGDAALFVTGDSPSAVRGGLIIGATDPAKARAALPRIAGALRIAGHVNVRPARVPGSQVAFQAPMPGAPAPLVLASGGDKVVVALGRAAATEALKPASTLGDTPLYGRAKDALGGIDPSIVVDAAAVIRLVEQAKAGDPGLAKARPYLDTLDLIASGGKVDGNDAVGRAVIKVR